MLREYDMLHVECPADDVSSRDNSTPRPSGPQIWWADCPHVIDEESVPQAPLDCYPVVAETFSFPVQATVALALG